MIAGVLAWLYLVVLWLTWTPVGDGAPEVLWGIGVSINVRFTDLAFADVPLEEVAERRVEVPGGLVSRIPGVGGGRAEAPSEEESGEPKLHYGFEISSVGCDFGP